MANLATIEIVSPATLQAGSVPATEVLRYAQFLGIDADNDDDMLWIAHAGLRALAPEPWLTCKKVGAAHIFFHNPVTGRSTWEHPQDHVFKELVSAVSASRITVPVTLTLRAAASECSDAVEVVAHKLSGDEVGTRVTSPGSVSLEQVCCELEQELCQFQPANTVVRFFLSDGTRLGRSYGARTVAEVFGIPRSRSRVPGSADTEVSPQLPAADCCLHRTLRRGAEPTQSDMVHGACFSL